jgi:hypothetical protein
MDSQDRVNQKKAGEILVREETCRAAHLNLDYCEQRLLQLKGRSQAVSVRVITCSQVSV